MMAKYLLDTGIFDHLHKEFLDIIYIDPDADYEIKDL